MRLPKRPRGFSPYAVHMADDVRTTDSGIVFAPLYSAESLNGWDPSEQLGLPGEAPFTRGVYPSMYRGRL